MVPEPDLPALSQTLIAQLLIAFIAVISVVMMAARLATKPLDQLARAADTLGHNLDAPPLSEEGLVETRLAAQAFNRMQARIKYLVNERTQALVAISHDLRTPLTRLRLRIEFVDDDQLRDQLAADLDAMSALIDQALEYLRELRDSEEMCPVDMNGLLQSLAENAALLGRPINIVGMAFTPYTGRLSALRRALLNLIDNAVRYGHGAHVRVEDGPAMLRLIVENNGPGMPSVEPSSIFTRCSRPGVLRSVDAGGAGLACSIAKDIALMHDGDLLIINHLEYGFSAVLELPRTPNVASKSLDQFSP
jgi:signal transduction histidine kinase